MSPIKFSHKMGTPKNQGQALVFVLLILIIASAITAGTAYRTTSDVRRTGREKASVDAFAYASSAIDDIRAKINKCMQTTPDAVSCVSSVCGGAVPCSINCKAGQSCPLLQNFQSSQCSELAISVNPSKTVSNRRLLQDEVIEYNVSGQAASRTPLRLTWSGQNLLIGFVGRNSSGKYYLDPTNGKIGLKYRGATNPVEGFTLSSGTLDIPSSSFNNIKVIRIKAIGGEAVFSISGFVDVAEIIYYSNGFCGDVSRSQALVETTRPFLTGIFDYGLYSNNVDKDLENGISF